MRADKKKNVDKVAAEVAKNPLIKQEDIVKNTGLGLGTVNRAIKEVEKYGKKDDRIIALTDIDFEIMQGAATEINRRVREEPKSLSPMELNISARESAKRYQIFRSDMTDEKGGLRPFNIVVLDNRAAEDLQELLD